MERDVRFYISRWLSRDEYEDLLRIGDYIGRINNKSVFRINFDKIMRENLSYNEVLELIENYNGIIPEIDKTKLRKELEKRRSVEIYWDGSRIVLRPHFYLGDIYRKIRDKINYDKKRRMFFVKPIYFFDVKKELSQMGVYIIDKTNIPLEAKLNFTISLKISLRPYQKEAVKQWLKTKRGIIALPTGAGKTVIAIAAIAELNVRTLIVTFTKDQMFQWKDMILKYTNLTYDKIGLYYGDEKRLGPITITTYQTAFRHIVKISPMFSLLVIDEVHHLPADKFKYIAMNAIAPYRLGLSATVVREDGKHEELFPLMGGIVYWKTANELANEGYLANYIIKTIYVDLTREEKKQLREFLILYRKFSKGRKFQELLEAAKKGDRSAINALRVHSRIKQIVQKSKEKIKTVEKIVRRELSKGSKIIVFTQYVDQAKELAERLGALLLIGEMNGFERKRTLERFRNMESGVLVVTTVGDEGLDIPDANIGIIVTGTGSRRQFIQRLGRLLRKGPDKGVAVLYEIVTKGSSEEYQSKKRRKIEQIDLDAELGEVDVNH